MNRFSDSVVFLTSRSGARIKTTNPEEKQRVNFGFFLSQYLNLFVTNQCFWRVFRSYDCPLEEEGNSVNIGFENIIEGYVNVTFQPSFEIDSACLRISSIVYNMKGIRLLILGITGCLVSPVVLYALTPPVNATDINWDERGNLDLTKSVSPYVTPLIETEPVPREVNEDAADDPAIWVHPTDSALSKIIGTDKRGGLAVYDLKGNQVQYLESGSINNVDVRYGFGENNDLYDIAAATNRHTRSIDVFRIDRDSGKLSLISKIGVSDRIDDIYGFCLGYDSEGNHFYAYANGKNGIVEQYELIPGEMIEALLVRTLLIPSQPEGMVCDDLLGKLYVGEEEKGIWKFESHPESGTEGKLIIDSDPESNPQLAIDIEGISLYFSDDSRGYLIASSQGNHSYAVFEREGDNRYIGSFSVQGNGGVDGVEETDGIDVINLPLGQGFEEGLFVAQDGYNFDPSGQPTSQNFKLIPWQNIAEALGLEISTTYDHWLNR